MSYPTDEEFLDLLLREPLDGVVRRHIFGGTPFAFRDSPEAFKLLAEHLCAALNLERDDVTLVGSGKIGFSLNPDNFPRRFSDDSDLDIVVVSPQLFDFVWHTVLRWHYPRRLERLRGSDGEWSGARRRELYWGWFRPDAIRYEGLSLPEALVPLRDLSTTWFNAFQSLGQYPELAARQVSGRLYRSWDLALMYHVAGLEKIRAIAADLSAEGDDGV